MALTTTDLELYNRCPMLYEQRPFYYHLPNLSSEITVRTMNIFSTLLIDKMRARTINRRDSNNLKRQLKIMAQGLSDASVTQLALNVSRFQSWLEGFNEPIVSVFEPYNWNGVEGIYHILSRHQHNTGRIVIIDPGFYGARWATDYFIYSIPVLAYRRQFGRKEGMLTVYDMKTGVSHDVLRNEERLEKHKGYVAATITGIAQDYRVPAYSACPECPIKENCQVITHDRP